MAPGEQVRFRRPGKQDGAGVWRLAQAAGTLEVNTLYYYLVFCHHFADTCVIAEDDDGLAGFVVGYRPPPSPEAVFVWQVAVDRRQRGRGVAGRMLDALTARLAGDGVRYLEATVAPSNAPSRALFRGFARRSGVECRETPLFTGADFGGEDHEPEVLFRIGPLDRA